MSSIDHAQRSGEDLSISFTATQDLDLEVQKLEQMIAQLLVESTTRVQHVLTVAFRISHVHHQKARLFPSPHKWNRYDGDSDVDKATSLSSTPKPRPIVGESKVFATIRNGFVVVDTTNLLPVFS